MQKNFINIAIIGVSALIVIILVVGYFIFTKKPSVDVTESVPISSPTNTSYTIDNVVYTLVNGVSEKKPPADYASVRLFGEPVFGDLDNDGDADAAVLLVSDQGGSGTFYYAAIARNTSYGYQSTNVLLLGDRIAPQTIEIQNGRAVYNYALRRADEPMTAQPSIGKSLWIQLDPKKNEIGEFVKDFEGEANAETMSLTMKPWIWLRTEYADGTLFTPRHEGAFIITFEKDGRFSAKTDCNSVGGTYLEKNSVLSFSDMMSTLMYCEDSDEANFTALLGEIKSYTFTGKGELLLNTDRGMKAAIFR